MLGDKEFYNGLTVQVCVCLTMMIAESANFKRGIY